MRYETLSFTNISFAFIFLSFEKKLRIFFFYQNLTLLVLQLSHVFSKSSHDGFAADSSPYSGLKRAFTLPDLIDVKKMTILS